MAKVLLVEDDNNLREIYEARLQAEGYDIVSARDGEEALVVAKAEQPDLVISDVMMPKISGFEMLDILRNTEGLKDVKVIMLTALGQAEDQTRADSLGADRYLVKSQVTLEDIVNAAKQLLTGETAAPAEAAPAPAVPEAPAAQPADTPEAAAVATPTPAAAPEPVAEPTPPVIPLAAPPADDVPAATEPQMPPTPASTVPNTPADAPAEPATDASASDDSQQTEAQEQATVDQQITDFVQSQPGTAPAAVEPTAAETPAEAPTTTPEQEQALNEAVANLSGDEAAPAAAPEAPAAPAEPAAETPAEAPTEEAGTTTHKKIIAPISDQESPKKSLDELLAEENAKEAAATPPAATTPQPAAPAPNPTAPQAPAQPAANKGDFDPNSIAL